MIKRLFFRVFAATLVASVASFSGCNPDRPNNAQTQGQRGVFSPDRDRAATESSEPEHTNGDHRMINPDIQRDSVNQPDPEGNNRAGGDGTP